MLSSSHSSTFKIVLVLLALMVVALLPGQVAAAPPGTTYTLTVAGMAPGAETGSGMIANTVPGGTLWAGRALWQ